MLTERLPPLRPLLSSLAAEPGRHSLEENLTEIARQAALFYEQSFPIAASLYAETELKRRHDDAVRQMGAGPHVPIQGLDTYLRAEQERAGSARTRTRSRRRRCCWAPAPSGRSPTTRRGRPTAAAGRVRRPLARTLLAGIAD